MPTRFVVRCAVLGQLLRIAVAPNVHGPRALREKHLVADRRIDQVEEGSSPDIAVDVFGHERLDPFLTPW